MVTSPSILSGFAPVYDVTEAFPDDDEIIDLTEEVFEEEVEPFEDFAAVSTAEPSPNAPLSTATMAELYVQQGFVRQAIGIYKEMLADDPTNERINARLNELLSQSSSLPATDSSASTYLADAPQMAEGGLLATLERWLDNIGRIKACRSKSA
jgi:thioredoxin-like negative regulator of GroEL